MRPKRLKLKLCPCCRGKARLLNGMDYTEWCFTGVPRVYVECVECGLRTDLYKTAKFAADAWNRRTSYE